jgi:hypothetical protein
MSTFDSQSTDGYSRGSTSAFGHLITYSVSASPSHSFSEGISHSSSWAGLPFRSYCGDAAYIARQIFRDEVRDALIVLKNCGALHTAPEIRWCVKEIMLLLEELRLS